MSEVLVALGEAGLVALWMPVIIWTGLAGVTMVALALARGMHPLLGYRLRQGLLLALPASVVVTPWLPVPELIRRSLPAELASPLDAAIPSTVTPGQLAVVQVDLGTVLPGLVTMAVILLALVRLSMLARDLRQLHRLRVAASALDDKTADRTLRELAHRLDLQRPVELLKGPDGSVPITFHWRRPAILVPRSLLGDPGALRIVLAHELIHVRRHDYIWALLDCLTSAAFAFHPLTWLLRRGIDRCRETSCDAEVVAAGFAPPEKYAEVLVRTHDQARVPMTAVAAGMAARSPTIKKRLETMQQFAHTKPTSRLRTVSAIAAALLFLVTTTVAGCVGRSEIPDSSQAPASSDGAVRYYPITVSDTVRYIYPASSRTQEASAALRRLEIELAYLQERMDALQEEADAIPRTRPELPPQGEDYPAYSRLMQRLTLLNEMLKERIRGIEILRMKQETERRLKEPAS